jgi:hypothetical protein
MRYALRAPASRSMVGGLGRCDGSAPGWRGDGEGRQGQRGLRSDMTEGSTLDGDHMR